MAVRAVDQLVGCGVRHLEVVQHENDDGDICFFVWDADRRLWDEERPRLLASPENPHGYTLEQALAQLRTEYSQDALELAGHPDLVSEYAARDRVITLLYEAEGRQRVLSGTVH
jgi:hypothetical protein